MYPVFYVCDSTVNPHEALWLSLFFCLFFVGERQTNNKERGMGNTMSIIGFYNYRTYVVKCMKHTVCMGLFHAD